MSDEPADSWVVVLLHAALVGVLMGGLAGAIATEVAVQQERRAVEANLPPGHQYRYPERNFYPLTVSGCGSAAVGTVIGGLLLRYTKGQFWLAILPVVVFLAVVMGLFLAYAAPMHWTMGTARREPFAVGGQVGGGVGAFFGVTYYILLTWNAWPGPNEKEKRPEQPQPPGPE